MDADAVYELLRDYIAARFRLMHEWSSDFDRSRVHIMEEAKARAAEIGIEWDDDLIPANELEAIQAIEEGA